MIYDKKQYHIPHIYSISHYVIGIISAFVPSLIMPFYCYQIGQLLCNRRVFLLHRKIEKGNHLPHTLKKLSQFFIGMLFGIFIINNII